MDPAQFGVNFFAILRPGGQLFGALALFLCREEARGMTMQDLTLSAGSLW